MLRDPLMGSSSSTSESVAFANNSQFLIRELDSNSPEFPDLIQIPTEDLVPLFSNTEPYQSLSQLIEQEPQEILTVHQVLPDLEEHDKGNVKFELNLAPQQKGKVNWFYSKNFNKVYIKLNEIFNVEVVYTPRNLNEKLYMRTMMVFNSEVSEPVVRCENHSSKDKAMEKNIKHSVLRCENPNVSYQGTVEGKNIGERLSVRIPLGCILPDDDNYVKQTIALKFVCQNSCVGRRETSIIFHLEDETGQILAKRLTAVKICSCPKRDMKKDENTEISRKRSRKDECPIGKKIMRVESDIKQEPEVENEDEGDVFSNVSEVIDIVPSATGFKLTLDLPDLEVLHHTIQCAFNKIAGQMALNPDKANMYTSYIRAIRKSLVKAKRLVEEQK